MSDEMILEDVKKRIGIDSSITQFDSDIIAGINTTFMILNQLGIGPTDPYIISGSTEKWSDFLGKSKNLEAVKSYVPLKVKMIFDPPTSSAVMESFNSTLRELEWRLNINVDPTTEELAAIRAEKAAQALAEGDDETI